MLLFLYKPVLIDEGRYHGGWLAPNIYYLGGAGCVNVNGVRIAGASGIYNSAHYRMGELHQIRSAIT